MKVFGCTTYYRNKPTRLFVATTSQQKAADLFGMTVRELHDGGTTRGPETNNPIERELALAEPGVVFVADNLRHERIEKVGAESEGGMKPNLKRPHDPIALAKLVGDIATGQVGDSREISTREALDALARHRPDCTQWLVQAALLMQCINAPGVDHAELHEMLMEHIRAMPEL